MTRRKRPHQVRFGIGSLNRPTPNWAKVAFGVALLLTTGLAGWATGTAMLTEAQKVEWVMILKLVDPFLFGLSKLFGLEPR